MTIWDNIYKNYQKTGETWATISEEIHPLFKEFLNRTNFEVKSVLDIGCGTGKYLKLLQAGGFKIDGVDSSETAVEMTKKELPEGSLVLCVNMFDFEIPKNKYDLVISISTIHHGTKDKVNELINKIHEALIDGGKVFITLPDFESSKKWNTFKDHEEIAEGTFAPLSGPEKGLPHSFYTEAEVKNVFSKFKNLQLNLDEIGRWVIRAEK